MNLADPNSKTDDEIEGLSVEEDSSISGYPIDTFLIRNETRTVHDVLRRIEKGMFKMDPEFQRDFIWEIDKQSKLIESVLMRIPLPVFYLAEDEKGEMIVVDGLQRLSTFQRYAGGKFQLVLPKQEELNGKLFADLSPKLQNRIEDCNLILYVIDAKVPEKARLDIFDRVNSGVPLTRQQMRNSLYSGEATIFLKDEAKSELFRRTTGGSLQTKSMRDREFINRFCAFYLLGYKTYKGDMDEFLAETLTKMNSFSSEEMEKLRSEFRRSLVNNYTVFSKYAFRKHYENSIGRGVINASLWDVMTTMLARQPEHIVEARAGKLREVFYRLMDDDKFNRAITYATNDTPRVKDRFEKSEEMFKEVFDVN